MCPGFFLALTETLGILSARGNLFGSQNICQPQAHLEEEPTAGSPASNRWLQDWTDVDVLVRERKDLASTPGLIRQSQNDLQ